MKKMFDFLIVSPYPTIDNIKDGMVQRIKAVDDEIKDCNRIYLQLSIKDFRKKSYKVEQNVWIYELNVFVHYFQIRRLLKQVKNIYVHSILNYFKFSFFFVNSDVNTFLDFHGAVPEEYAFQGASFIKVKIANFLEKKAVSHFVNLICVSYNMRDHFRKKYPLKNNFNYIIKPILPTNILEENTCFNPLSFKDELNIRENEVVLIYSGNLQAWQNFELMLNIIKETENNNYKYIILTKQVGEAFDMIKMYDLDMDKLIVRSVLPNELYKYYSISNYGFLLRDEHVLNNVAAPTKLIEYLYYGIIPILKYADIGDNNYYHYDYVDYKSNELQHLDKRKSSLNKKIAEKILNLSIKSNIGYLRK
ncbi:hypothetical protein ACGE0T_07350 [Parabacteroides sp. APC149_11_2_Y6]